MNKFSILIFGLILGCSFANESTAQDNPKSEPTEQEPARSLNQEVEASEGQEGVEIHLPSFRLALRLADIDLKIIKETEYSKRIERRIQRLRASSEPDLEAIRREEKFLAETLESIKQYEDEISIALSQTNLDTEELEQLKELMDYRSMMEYQRRKRMRQAIDAYLAQREALFAEVRNLRNGEPADKRADEMFTRRYKRWKVEYLVTDIDLYAAQLSHFDIDMGVVSRNKNEIIRIKDINGQIQLVHSNRENESATIFFAHSDRTLQEWDKRLAKRAGLSLDDRSIVEFYPESMLETLRQVEADYLKSIDRTIYGLRRTYFKIQETDEGFKFVVDKVEFEDR